MASQLVNFIIRQLQDSQPIRHQRFVRLLHRRVPNQTLRHFFTKLQFTPRHTSPRAIVTDHSRRHVIIRHRGLTQHTTTHIRVHIVRMMLTTNRAHRRPQLAIDHISPTFSRPQTVIPARHTVHLLRIQLWAPSGLQLTMIRQLQDGPNIRFLSSFTSTTSHHVTSPPIMRLKFTRT